MNTFNKGDTVVVNNKIQSNYSFELVENLGEFPVDFRPDISPIDMLRLGVFEGKYMNDCKAEYPVDMFRGARLSDSPDPTNTNAFKTKSRLPLTDWQKKGWIHQQDPRGWFEWYCRYYMGRRTEDDKRQIDRWRRFAPRHEGAVIAFGDGDISLRKATRQGLLQWAHDPLPDIPRLFGETVVDKIYRVTGIQRKSTYEICFA